MHMLMLGALVARAHCPFLTYETCTFKLVSIICNIVTTSKQR